MHYYKENAFLKVTLDVYGVWSPQGTPRYLGWSKLIFQMLLCFWRTPGQPSHHQACHGVVKVNLRSTHKQHADLYILGGGFTQIWKIWVNMEIFPKIGVKMKQKLKPPTSVYIYMVPPKKKPTFLHFFLVCTVFLAYLGTFFLGIFWMIFEVVFTNVYKRYGSIAADLDPRSKIQDSRKNFLDPRSGSRPWIQEVFPRILDLGSWIQTLDPRRFS